MFKHRSNGRIFCTRKYRASKLNIFNFGSFLLNHGESIIKNMQKWSNFKLASGPVSTSGSASLGMAQRSSDFCLTFVSQNMPREHSTVSLPEKSLLFAVNPPNPKTHRKRERERERGRESGRERQRGKKKQYQNGFMAGLPLLYHFTLQPCDLGKPVSCGSCHHKPPSQSSPVWSLRYGVNHSQIRCSASTIGWSVVPNTIHH